MPPNLKVALSFWIKLSFDGLIIPSILLKMQYASFTGILSLLMYQFICMCIRFILLNYVRAFKVQKSHFLMQRLFEGIVQISARTYEPFYRLFLSCYKLFWRTFNNKKIKNQIKQMFQDNSNCLCQVKLSNKAFGFRCFEQRNCKSI